MVDHGRDPAEYKRAYECWESFGKEEKDVALQALSKENTEKLLYNFWFSQISENRANRARIMQIYGSGVDSNTKSYHADFQSAWVGNGLENVTQTWLTIPGLAMPGEAT